LGNVVLKAEGTQTTDTAVPDASRQFLVQNGTLDGNEITFRVGPRSGAFSFELTDVRDLPQFHLAV